MKTFARKCSVTGDLFNEGYVWYDGAFYTKDEPTTANEIRKCLADGTMLDALPMTASHLLTIEDDLTLISLVCELDEYAIYYTEWEEDDYQYAVDADGNEIELI
jgi:hypothetical protein